MIETRPEHGGVMLAKNGERFMYSTERLIKSLQGGWPNGGNPNAEITISLGGQDVSINDVRSSLNKPGQSLHPQLDVEKIKIIVAIWREQFHF